MPKISTKETPNTAQTTKPYNLRQRNKTKFIEFKDPTNSQITYAKRNPKTGFRDHTNLSPLDNVIGRIRRYTVIPVKEKAVIKKYTSLIPAEEWVRTLRDIRIQADMIHGDIRSVQAKLENLREQTPKHQSTLFHFRDTIDQWVEAADTIEDCANQIIENAGRLKLTVPVKTFKTPSVSSGQSLPPPSNSITETAPTLTPPSSSITETTPTLTPPENTQGVPDQEEVLYILQQFIG